MQTRSRGTKSKNESTGRAAALCRQHHAQSTDRQAALTVSFEIPQVVSCVVLGEYLPAGQRIEADEIRADGQRVACFTTVGHKRICCFPPVKAQTLEVRITASRAAPTLRLLAVYR